jgi:predicted site-specific integrase-resolvase
MKEYLSVGEVSLELGVCVKTLHRWEKSKKLLSSFRTFGSHRRYLKYDVLKIKNKEKRINIGYARVSSHDQKDDLVRQTQYLKDFSQQNNIPNLEIIEDLGSGLNFKKKGLKKLISLIISSSIDTIYLTHKDRLLRFGTELIVSISKCFGNNIVFINHNESETFESTLAKDLLEIITVFSAKLYGYRSHKNKKSLKMAT